jgi:hypothetical protein
LRIAAEQEPVCWVISGDLAHIGPKFGARRPVSEDQLIHSKTQDLRLLEAAARCDAEAYHGVVVDEADERNICGHPPTWLTLHASGVTRGETLEYGRYTHPRGKESVSFAGMVFER